MRNEKLLCVLYNTQKDKVNKPKICFLHQYLPLCLDLVERIVDGVMKILQ